MDALFQFLQAYEVWVYLILGGIGIIYLKKLLSALYEWRTSIFGLERETALRKVTASFTVVLLLVIFVVTEFVVVSFVAPVIPKQVSLATPTVVLGPNPNTPIDELAGNEPEVADTTPNVGNNTTGEGCIPGIVEWSKPIQSEEVNGTIELAGTVNIPDLGFFKYEYATISGNEWTTIAAVNTQKNDETFGNWDTSLLVPGDYKLRLVVSNNQGLSMPPCEVIIRILAP